MSEIFHARFDSGTDSFSAGTHTTSVGSAVLGDTDGALTVGSAVTANRDFTGVTTGKVRVDFWFKITATTTSGGALGTLIYLMANGVSPSSGSSICTIAISYFTGDGASSTLVALAYRGASAFVALPATGTTTMWKLTRGAYWYKMSIVADWSAKTCDIYIGDIMVVKGAAWPNTSAADIGRVSLVGPSGAPDVYFDNILVQDAWSEGESVLVDHTFVGGSGEIEASVPSTYATQHAQTWKIADDTATYGGFTLGANGAQPDASKSCVALQRLAAPDGIIECEFQTPASGTAYFGIAFRFWDYPTTTNGGGGVFRVSGSGNTAVLLLPDRSGTLQTVQSSSLTPSANTTYTLKIELRGRVMICSYKAAAIGSGSYTTLWTHTAYSSATGGRGMLIEDLAGPFVNTVIGATSNYVRRFRYTGKVPDLAVTKTIGDYKAHLDGGSIKELYALASADTDANLFWSRGIQFGHRSSADMCGAQQVAEVYDTTNVYATRQVGHSITEYQHLGFADCYVTLLHRGPWVSDGITVTDASENYGPDFDLRGEVNSKSFYTCTNSGAGTSRSDSTYHDWTVYNVSATLPCGNQSVSAFGSGSELRMSQIVIAVENSSGASWDITSKFEGNGDPISRAIGRSVSAGTSYRVARGWQFKYGAALSGTDLATLRDDFGAPATLTMTTGSAKTDAAGDANTDGFNERHGWYEVTCSGGVAEFTLPISSGTRHMPAFRLHSWTNTNTEVLIDSVVATDGTDYVLDEVASGVAVLQILSDLTADTLIEIAAGSSLPTLTSITASAITTTGLTDTIAGA